MRLTEFTEQNVDEGYYDLNDDGMQPIDLASNPSLRDLMNRHSQLYYQGMEGSTTDEEHAEQDAIEQYALKKFGQKGLDSLNNATQTNFWGRKDGRGLGGYRGDNLGRASAPSGNFRTTKSGKMHGQDVKMMKNKVADRLGRHPEPALPESSENRSHFIRHNIWTVMDGDEEVMQHPVEGDPFFSAKKFIRDLDDEGYEFTHVVSPEGKVTYLPHLDPRNFPKDVSVDDIASEGYRVVPGFDKEKYQEREGLEGPFHTKSGKVVYYDKKEGSYYDPDTDMYISYEDWQAMNEEGVTEGLPQTLRKVVPGYAKREIDKKMDAGKFGKTDADKDANFQRYKKIQDKIKEQGVAEGSELTVQQHKSPYEGAEVGEYTTMFKASPNSAQRFAKHIISKGGRARIGKRGQDYYVYHNMLMSKEDWRKSEQQGVAEGSPELLKAEMPLVRHIEQELTKIGYKKGTPEFNAYFNDAIKFYRKFGSFGFNKNQGVAEGSMSPDEYKQKLLNTIPRMMDFYEKNVKGWKPSEEQMLAAVETGYIVMKRTGDVQQAGKAVMDELNTLHKMSQGQQGVAEGGIVKSIKRGIQGWGIGAAPDMVTPAGAVSAFKNMDGQRLANFVASRKDQSKPRKNSAGAFVDKVIDREMKQRGYGRVANKDEQGVTEAGFGRASWDSNMPGYQGDYGGAENWGRRHREDDEHHEIDRQREQQATSGTWYITIDGKLLKNKEGQPFTFVGKAAANKAALTMMQKPFNQGKKFMLTTKGE